MTRAVTNKSYMPKGGKRKFVLEFITDPKYPELKDAFIRFAVKFPLLGKLPPKQFIAQMQQKIMNVLTKFYKYGEHFYNNQVTLQTYIY